MAESAGDADDQRQMEQKQRLEGMLYDLADAIGDMDETDRFWSATVRTSADQVRAGQVSGLRDFLGLFGGMGSINDQAFSGVLGGDLSRAHALASSLLGGIRYDSSNYGRRKVSLRPWAEGHAGKAVVYKDGTVITTDDDAPGNPQFSDIYGASGQDGNNQAAIMAIGPDGSCDIFRVHCNEKWLAATLHSHDSRLHLVGPLPPKT